MRASGPPTARLAGEPHQLVALTDRDAVVVEQPFQFLWFGIGPAGFQVTDLRRRAAQDRRGLLAADLGLLAHAPERRRHLDMFRVELPTSHDVPQITNVVSLFWALLDIYA